jgi:hypothetical protein
MSKFKVGDRVMVSDKNWSRHYRGTIAICYTPADRTEWDYLIDFDDGTEFNFLASSIEHLDEAVIEAESEMFGDLPPCSYSCEET